MEPQDLRTRFPFHPASFCPGIRNRPSCESFFGIPVLTLRKSRKDMVRHFPNPRRNCISRMKSKSGKQRLQNCPFPGNQRVPSVHKGHRALWVPACRIFRAKKQSRESFLTPGCSHLTECGLLPRVSYGANADLPIPFPVKECLISAILFLSSPREDPEFLFSLFFAVAAGEDFGASAFFASAGFTGAAGFEASVFFASAGFTEAGFGASAFFASAGFTGAECFGASAFFASAGLGAIVFFTSEAFTAEVLVAGFLASEAFTAAEGLATVFFASPEPAVLTGDTAFRGAATSGASA